jgi:tripartite ATP-independent transporter DctM subunit
MVKLLARFENMLAVVVLGAMVLLSTVSSISRLVSGTEIPGTSMYIQHFNLLITFIGAIIATRAGRHLTLSTGHTLSAGRFGWLIGRIGGTVGGTVSVVLAKASWDMAMAQRDAPGVLPGGIPVWVFQLALPIGFGLIALRFFWHNTTFLKGLIPAVVMIGAMYALGFVPEGERGWVLAPMMTILLATGLLGTPMFTLMGGAAMLLFFTSDVPISAVPTETYHIVVSPTLPVIPLFTFTGYLLARGGASKRLIRLFNACFGWMPGGVAVVTALVCAFFTTFTGASGVTILGMGGFLFPMLVEAGYSTAFSLGLLTTAGSLGMLFPPSLPVILYGVVGSSAEHPVPIDKLFIGGFLPGLLLIGVVTGYGIYQGIKLGVPRQKFAVGEVLSAARESIWELLLPVLLLSGIFMGFVNLGQAASLVTVYILIVECAIKRELSLIRDVPEVMIECATVIGALLIIFGAALGMTSYMVDAEIPTRLAEWVQTTIHAKWLFILVLNLVLLVVGSLMEGFSAIVVLVPLIAPIGVAFGLNPIHLGILFLANLELGFLLPPVGLNLFLSSIRFQRPLASMYRPILPFLLLLGVAVLVISYVPELSLILLPADAAAPLGP